MKSVTTVEDRKEGRRVATLRFFALAAAIFVVGLLAGCSFRQPGQTRAEVARRHDRILRLDSEMLMSDIDRVFMLDEPSRLTDKRIP